jgi:hypothetical protein
LPDIKSALQIIQIVRVIFLTFESPTEPDEAITADYRYFFTIPLKGAGGLRTRIKQSSV